MVQIQDLDEVLQAESTDKVMVTHTDNKTDVIKVSNLFKGPEAGIAALQEDVAAVQEDVAAIQEELPKKLDNKTIAENAGKAVVVDEEGNLVFGAAGVQVSKEEGNTIEEKEDGIYVAPVTGGSSPVGTILSFIGSEAPAGFLLFDGSEYKGEDYPKLYNLVRNYPVFAGATEGYFKLPNLAGRVLQGATIENLGELIAAGLPNITGAIQGLLRDEEQISSGALKGRIIRTANTGGNSKGFSGFDFNAKDGETKTDGTLKTADEPHVYGNSDTVQPAALAINYMIKATNTNESLDDIIDDTTNDTGHAPSTARVNVLARNFAVCNTAAADTVKEVTIDNLVALEIGLEIKVLFTNGNTAGTCVGTDSNKIALAAAPKIKVNNLGEYPVKIGGEYAGENFVNIGDVHTFVFDGENWNDLTADVIYKGSTTNGNYMKKRNLFLSERITLSPISSIGTWSSTVTINFPVHFSSTGYKSLLSLYQLGNSNGVGYNIINKQNNLIQMKLYNCAGNSPVDLEFIGE